MVNAQNTTQQWIALCYSWLQFYTVSPCILSLHTTSQIRKQCLTDLNILFVVVESIFKIQESAVLYCYFRQSLELDNPAFSFKTPCHIHNLSTPHCLRLNSLPKMNGSLFVIETTLCYKLYLMLDGLQWMNARNSLLLAIIQDLHCGVYSIYTV